MSGIKILTQIKITLRNRSTLTQLPVIIDVFDNSLAHKWLAALNHLLKNQYHLEKNYCFFGFADSERNGSFLLDQVNCSIQAINSAELGYIINDSFSMSNTITDVLPPGYTKGRILLQDRMNNLHRYFEDLQGQSGNMSKFYTQADATTQWHIRQLNLLCHEFEAWALSYRKQIHAPEWQRPSQLMCWLNAPRFTLDEKDFELFGIETINRPLGGVFVGVNKAVGKHHWEVFSDEGRDSRISELTTTTLSSQTEAAGDFDIEWANDPGQYKWQKTQLAEFKQWLINNGFDPENKSLTIGHPQVGQVNLEQSFNTTNYKDIWQQIEQHFDVYSIQTSDAGCFYEYHWSDADYQQQQIDIIQEKQNELD
jgi:hypothetical protein